MTEAAQPASTLLYGLEDKPAPWAAALAALQHILASIVGIVTPTLVIGGVLGLGAEIPYLIAMSLFVSGIATVIQSKTVGPVGSGSCRCRAPALPSSARSLPPVSRSNPRAAGPRRSSR